MREALDRTCGVASEILVIKTSGDRFTSAPLEQIGLKGVFTKELEDALIDGRADLAVHSMKDVPTEFSDACRITTVFQREDPRDALVSRARPAACRDCLRGARVGTGSLRRSAQLRAIRPDLAMAEIRGNVDTRLRKLDCRRAMTPSSSPRPASTAWDFPRASRRFFRPRSCFPPSARALWESNFLPHAKSEFRVSRATGGSGNHARG